MAESSSSSLLLPYILLVLSLGFSVAALPLDCFGFLLPVLVYFGFYSSSAAKKKVAEDFMAPRIDSRRRRFQAASEMDLLTMKLRFSFGDGVQMADVRFSVATSPERIAVVGRSGFMVTVTLSFQLRQIAVKWRSHKVRMMIGDILTAAAAATAWHPDPARGKNGNIR